MGTEITPVGLNPGPKVGRAAVAAVQESARSAAQPVQVPLAQPLDERQEPAVEQVVKAVSRINDFMQAERRSILFNVDESTGQTVITISDKETGQLIRQIPAQEVLEISQSLKELQIKLYSTQV